MCPRAPWDFHATREHSATAPGRRNGRRRARIRPRPGYPCYGSIETPFP
ncbi:uncharacterized protein AruCF_2654 [Achromobacter ruhlandii]|nr:uncharacterized protein AruCF_2654 [Achromobacter ruhlandii]